MNEWKYISKYDMQQNPSFLNKTDHKYKVNTCRCLRKCDMQQNSDFVYSISQSEWVEVVSKIRNATKSLIPE